MTAVNHFDTTSWHVRDGHKMLKLETENLNCREKDVKVHVVVIAVAQLFFTFINSWPITYKYTSLASDVNSQDRDDTLVRLKTISRPEMSRPRPQPCDMLHYQYSIKQYNNNEDII